MKSLWCESLMAEEKKRKSDQSSISLQRSSMRAERRTRPARMGLPVHQHPPRLQAWIEV
jgi:hypothetical protein